jgi:hypothetical protein
VAKKKWVRQSIKLKVPDFDWIGTLLQVFEQQNKPKQ